MHGILPNFVVRKMIPCSRSVLLTVFLTLPTIQYDGCDVFTDTGFKSWKNINAVKYCAFLNHIGEDLYSYQYVR
ncbi:hypothetical protein I3760_16G077900 [Carya illinoinensis]|nr:hypothetical protein I3760_16G077900 [Carya illinoinensis]